MTIGTFKNLIRTVQVDDIVSKYIFLFVGFNIIDTMKHVQPERPRAFGPGPELEVCFTSVSSFKEIRLCFCEGTHPKEAYTSLPDL